ncbi:hypothetical protein F8388_015900 [Cannabis sativa]|uniref:Uncharacterized protein n=1 Tax=Cannabis sativa TaxID=3483 RepID=A0A7J6EBI7_CANSA|nr:hypothetical protein G4B88_019928 [Cannabis sativa]KAF4359860.1 hypothetical protein F8388_015900 [Cannabis sativa]
MSTNNGNPTLEFSIINGQWSVVAKDKLDEMLRRVHLLPSLFNISDTIIKYAEEKWVDASRNFAIKVYTNAIGYIGNTEYDGETEYDQYDIDDYKINFVPAIEESMERLEKAEIKDDQIISIDIKIFHIERARYGEFRRKNSVNLNKKRCGTNPTTARKYKV